ncbi:MAG: hypothetical protein Ta2G_02270 [Termitinemataceae bacterium]|nr:MAG: hypothetical protein Ta2G_02270 [Termitinemataceae bacterium]
MKIKLGFVLLALVSMLVFSSCLTYTVQITRIEEKKEEKVGNVSITWKSYWYHPTISDQYAKKRLKSKAGFHFSGKRTQLRNFSTYNNDDAYPDQQHIIGKLYRHDTRHKYTFTASAEVWKTYE